MKRPSKPKAKPARKRCCEYVNAGDNPAGPALEAGHRAIAYLEAKLELAERFGATVSRFYQARNKFFSEHGQRVALYDDGSREIVE